MSQLSKNARTVLQAIEDLQFTGRPDPRTADLAEDYGIDSLVYFDPVPVVAIHGELSPFSFDLNAQLRLLETEEAVTHSLSQKTQYRTFIRPDGKTVRVGKRSKEDAAESYREYFASVEGYCVYESNVHLPLAIEERSKIDGSNLYDRTRINSYQMTKVGRAMLAEQAPDVNVPLSTQEQNVLDVIIEHGKPLTGKEIVGALEKKGISVAQATLTRHIIPKLKRSHCVRNKSGSGYYILEQQQT